MTAITGCAQSFPRPSSEPVVSSATMSGQQLFDKSLTAHGGNDLSNLKAVTTDTTGHWHFWVTRIQPLVSDHTYRVDSKERLFIHEYRYEADYSGPAGTKTVERTSDAVKVSYNGHSANDPEVLASTAMTADAFYLFSLGPLALANRSLNFARISDEKISDKNYFRIYAKLEPGFGYSNADELTLWIDPETYWVKRYAITLQGFKSTQGAFVDTTVTNYEKLGNYVFPQAFKERVRAPIKIPAHEWHHTNIEIEVKEQ